MNMTRKLMTVAYFSAVATLLALGFHGLALAGPAPLPPAYVPIAAPELDPQMIAAGLAVCVTGAALLLERYRHRER